MRFPAFASFPLLLLMLVGCASAPQTASRDTGSADCATGAVQLKADFPQARAEDCRRTGPASFSVVIRPEATPINPSPWYAFEIVSDKPVAVDVTLDYAGADHRYRSGAGPWQALPARAVTLRQDGKEAELAFDAAPGRTRIAAQELISPEARLEWIARFAEQTGFERVTLGQTVQGRPVEALTGGASGAGTPLVILLGGQHPPEVPGVLGLRAFLEALLKSDEASQALLAQYRLLIVPEMNLDGIVAGHWRLNAGETDLNRDWGLFTQPETRAVGVATGRLVDAGYRPVLMLDFHATWRNVFYTPPDTANLALGNFTTRWLSEIDARWDGAMPERSSSHNPGRPTSRSWFSETFQASGLTVEFGDETPRGEIDALARIYAASLLDLLSDADTER